jgi:metal-responsive CopG/Arc/MetJ family transcriptional regulator
VKNVQISFDEELLETVDALAASSQLSRSAVVREALKTWIRRQQVEEFEDAWIRKLKENPQEQEEADAWVEANSWSDE